MLSDAARTDTLAGPGTEDRLPLLLGGRGREKPEEEEEMGIWRMEEGWGPRLCWEESEPNEDNRLPSTASLVSLAKPGGQLIVLICMYYCQYWEMQ